jgi:paraquat-inducible protein B
METLDSPVIKTKKGISPIWILPIVAILIGAWLIYKDYQESGFMIKVQIKDASGLTAGKTQVMFKGLPVGTLKSFHVSPDLLSIDAKIEMVKEAREKLTTDAKFWVVRPELSANRITGLETLVTGSYFEVQPGTNPGLTLSFVALDEAPPLSTHVPGLHLTLKSEKSVVLSPGSPVYFKKVEVGEIVSNALLDDSSIETKILIYPQYTGHVSSKSLFFVSGGIRLDANLPKISLHIDPIKSIIRGGISFITPDGGEKIQDLKKSIPLHKDFEAAQHAGDIEITLTFSVEHGLQAGSEIRYNGIQIGSIKELQLDEDMKTIRAKAYIHKSLDHLLRVDTYIWAVNAKFSAAGIANLATLLKGAHLNLIAGQGKQTTKFQVHDTRPPNITVDTGLNLVMETDRLGSLGYDKPVYYRQVQVGHTTGYELSATGQNVLVYLNIHEPFVNLIRENTKFWNSSGFRIKGGLMTEMRISTESLATLIGGGISFSTPEKEEMGNRVSNGKHFTLHTEPDDKWLNWSPALELGELTTQLLQNQKEGAQE